MSTPSELICVAGADCFLVYLYLTSTVVEITTIRVGRLELDYIVAVVVADNELGSTSANPNTIVVRRILLLVR